MELLFTGPGPPGRRTVSQTSFIRPCPHASQSPGAGLGAARCLKTQVMSRGGMGEVKGEGSGFSLVKARDKDLHYSVWRKLEEGRKVFNNNNRLQGSLCHILFSLPQGRGSVGVGESRNW